MRLLLTRNAWGFIFITSIFVFLITEDTETVIVALVHHMTPLT